VAQKIQILFIDDIDGSARKPACGSRHDTRLRTRGDAAYLGTDPVMSG
jgi:hypothetical protein